MFVSEWMFFLFVPSLLHLWRYVCGFHHKVDAVFKSILAEPQSRKLKLILLQDHLYTTTTTTAVICIRVVWALFYVSRCWSLRWFNEDLYI